MTKLELIQRLHKCEAISRGRVTKDAEDGDEDGEVDTLDGHVIADDVLLQYINDPDITAAYNAIWRNYE